MMRRNRRLLNRILAATLAACASLMLITAPAGLRAQTAGDLASKSQQAAQITQEMNALDQQMAVATEAYNRVKVDLDAITARVDVTQKRLYDIRQSLKKRRDLLNQRAATMYKDGRTSMLEVLLRTKDFGDFLEQADYISRIAQNDANLIERIKTTRDSVEVLDRDLNEQRRQQQGLVQQAEAKKTEIEMGLGQRQAILNSVNQDIQNLIAQQLNAQQAGPGSPGHRSRGRTRQDCHAIPRRRIPLGGRRPGDVPDRRAQDLFRLLGSHDVRVQAVRGRPAT
jgi:peptidoglycan hydrolase CwlO-like protein